MAASCDILMFDGTVTPRFPNNVNNTDNQSIQRKTGYHTTFKV